MGSIKKQNERGWQKQETKNGTKNARSKKGEGEGTKFSSCNRIDMGKRGKMAIRGWKTKGSLSGRPAKKQTSWAMNHVLKSVVRGRGKLICFGGKGRRAGK